MTPIRDDGTSIKDEANIKQRITRRGFLKSVSTSTIAGALVTSGTPGIPSIVDTASGAHEPYRPDYHFTPSKGWMNDPNGLVYHAGTYHLFYQAGETRRRWDHAISTNLYDWTEQGTAIPDANRIQAYSGGAVVDTNNTAGFGNDAIVCMYTGHHDNSTEDQRLAYSTDGGNTFIKYSGNPVIDTNHDDWRDPVPFWYEPTEEWRLVVCRVNSHSYNGTTYPSGVEIWKSHNLKEWTYMDTYESDGASWECPDLFQLPVDNTDESRWIMSMSVEFDHHEYHIGHFDGMTFTVDRTNYADDGWDFYAAQTWSNESNSNTRLMTAWLSDWKYATEMPERGWAGHQMFPRRIKLHDTGSDIVIVESPDSAIREAHSKRLADVTDESITSSKDPLDGEGITGQHLDIDMTFNPNDADSVTLKVRENALQETRLTYDVVNAELLFDRSDSGNMFPGTYSGFPEVGSVPLDIRSDGTIQLRVLIDSSVVEIYANNGQKTLCHQTYPDNAARATSLTANGGTAILENLTAHRTNTKSHSHGHRLSNGAVYRIQNRNSGLSLEVKNASESNGAYVVQNKFTGEAHQRWTAKQSSTGAWRLENANSGKVIDIENGSASQGAPCIQQSWTNAARQKWSITKLNGDYLHVKNIYSDWALDIEDASASTGTRTMQWEYWAGNNQKWQFKRLE